MEVQFKAGQLKRLFIAIPAVLILLTAIFIIIPILRQAAPPSMQPHKVVLGTVETREITRAHEYIAKMEADNLVDLKARVSGFLVSKAFDDGDLVKKGEILFQIEPDRYQALVDSAKASVLSAEAQLNQATLDFARTSELYAKRTTPKSDYDQVKAQLETAQANLMSAQAMLKEAELNLGYASVRAPFDGQISDTPFSVGSLLEPDSGVLAQVVSLDPILVTFGISDKVIQANQTDEIAKSSDINDWQVRLELAPGHYYPTPGKFSYVSPTVDQMTDTIKFKAKFANPDKVLRPGQIVRARVEQITPRSLLIMPKEAVLTDTDGNYIFVLKQVPSDPENPDSPPMFLSEKRVVTIDPSIELVKDYAIASGVKAGEEYILKGLMFMGATLRPGIPVMPVPASDAPASQAPEGEKAAKSGETKEAAEGEAQ